jgi:hypothetical protein
MQRADLVRSACRPSAHSMTAVSPLDHNGLGTGGREVEDREPPVGKPYPWRSGRGGPWRRSRSSADGLAAFKASDDPGDTTHRLGASRRRDTDHRLAGQLHELTGAAALLTDTVWLCDPLFRSRTLA